MNTQNQQPELAHNGNCKMAFGRKDPDCARCQQLLAGAKPRAGWQQAYFSRKKIEDAALLNAIRTHDCKKSNCGHQCTAFDH